MNRTHNSINTDSETLHVNQAESKTICIKIPHELCLEKIYLRGFQPGLTKTEKIAWFYETEGLRYLCTENKVLISSYHTADLRLCFFAYVKSRISHDLALCALPRENLLYVCNKKDIVSLGISESPKKHIMQTCPCNVNPLYPNFI